ncbi:porin [Parvibaculum sp.]|uniref:porin n=1 Tax=Parvibaculum sp. TaxID=2024848 RepID=UPI00320EBEFA
MKKTLLATTALVTTGLLAGPALASDPLKVTVGGNVVTGFYFVDADNVSSTSYQDTKVAVVARNIDIKAEGTLDNGLVAGVDAKLQLSNDWNSSNHSSAASFRQLFAYLEGSFGKFEIGGTDGAAYKMHYTSPWFVPGNGVDSPNILNIVPYYGERHSTFSLLATDANKVSYFTPRFAGFQLGVSYTPDANNKNPKANGLSLAAKTDAYMRDVFEIAGNYAGTLGGVDLGVDGFYTTGKGDHDNVDPEEYGFGANVGYAGFTLGGAWYRSEDIWAVFDPDPSYYNNENTTWTLGLKYATGPWTVGTAYLDGDQDWDGYSYKVKTLQVGGGYNLGSGVDLGLDIQFSNYKNNDNDLDYDSKSAGLVLAIAF